MCFLQCGVSILILLDLSKSLAPSRRLSLKQLSHLVKTGPCTWCQNIGNWHFMTLQKIESLSRSHLLWWSHLAFPFISYFLIFFFLPLLFFVNFLLSDSCFFSSLLSFFSTLLTVSFFKTRRQSSRTSQTRNLPTSWAPFSLGSLSHLKALAKSLITGKSHTSCVAPGNSTSECQFLQQTQLILSG